MLSISLAKLKPAFAAAIMGLAGTLQAPEPPSQAAMQAQLNELAANGQYDMAAKIVASYVRVTPPDPLVYAAWMASLASANRMDEARAVFADAKRKFPQLVERYAPEVERHLAKIESAHIARAAASTAAAAGNFKLAATRLADAYEVFSSERMLGLQVAQLWAWVKEPVKAARIYNKLALTDDPDIKEEAALFMAENKVELGRAANAANTAGWRIVESANPSSDALEQARKHFEEADELITDFATLGVHTMRGPYMGLAILSAMNDLEFGAIEAIRRGRSKGMPVLSGTLPRSGAKFAAAMCSDYLRDELVKIYETEIVRRWAIDVCAAAEKDKSWVEAVDKFNVANHADTSVSASILGYQEAREVFTGSWDGERATQAAGYARRAGCNILFLEAWKLATGPKPDFNVLGPAITKSAACATPDYPAKALTDKVTEIQRDVTRANMFTLKVCNRTTEDTMSVAIARYMPDNLDEHTLTGWFNVARNQCIDLNASYGMADETDVYLTASAKNTTWWPVEKGDAAFCIASEKTDRKVDMTDAPCEGAATRRGFVKITVRKRPGKNGATYNFKNP